MDAVIYYLQDLRVQVQQQQLVSILSALWKAFYYCNTVESCFIDHTITVSVRMEIINYRIKVQVRPFNILPPIDTLSDCEDTASWENLTDGFETAIKDLTILLDQY